MPLPIAIPLAISAIKALLRFRDQVDTILSLNEATTGLPFALPPPPTDNAPYLPAMRSFFQAGDGQTILQLHGLQNDFAVVSNHPTSLSPETQAALSRLFTLYYEAADVQPVMLGPDDPRVQAGKSRGPSTQMRLAYYVVESQRLSRNPALVRVLLAASDTLFVFAGENANLFISNPQTRSLVENLIEEFASKRDFNDEGIETIFKALLGSTVLAFANNPGNLANKPALKALFAALGDVRDQLGNNFVAKIISVDGFEQLIAAFATGVAKDPAFIINNDLVQKVLTATLTEIGNNFVAIVDDPKALLGVLEVGLDTSAANVASILQGELGGQPLLAAVLTSVLKQITALAQHNQLIASITHGQIVPDIYKTTLLTIAANPIKFANPNDVDKFVSNLVDGLAGTLAQRELSTLFTTDTLKLLAAGSLTVLSAHPLFLADNNQFATKLLAAVFKAGATVVSDGLTADDLLDIADVAMRTAAENLALLKLNTQLAATIASLGDAIAAGGLQQLLNPQGRKALLLAALQAVAANPTVWGGLQDRKLIQPLVEAILQGLATDQTHLLSGPVLVDAAQRILLAAVRRGQQLIDQALSPDDLKKLLMMAVHRAQQEIGKTIDGENLPAFLERVVATFLSARFTLTDEQAAEFKQLMNAVLVRLDGGNRQ